MHHVAAIIVAAGSGTRMGGEIPKQFIDIGGKPILQHTLEKFQTFDEINTLYVVLPAQFANFESTIRDEWHIKKLVKVIKGGAERHESVFAGISAVDKNAEIIMIHDGVRPFVSLRILSDSIRAAQEFGAAVVGLPPKDTVKLIDGNRVQKTMVRDQLILAQTPQTFRRDVIVKANELAFEKNEFSTDDAALVERMGHPVAIVKGEWRNFKITSPEDVLVAKALLREGE